MVADFVILGAARALKVTARHAAATASCIYRRFRLWEKQAPKRTQPRAAEPRSDSRNARNGEPGVSPEGLVLRRFPSGLTTRLAMIESQNLVLHESAPAIRIAVLRIKGFEPPGESTRHEASSRVRGSVRKRRD